jgi:gas vesicle protein
MGLFKKKPHNFVGKARENVNDFFGHAEDKVEHLKEKTNEIKDKAEDKAEQMKMHAGEFRDKAADKLKSWTAGSQSQEHHQCEDNTLEASKDGSGVNGKMFPDPTVIHPDAPAEGLADAASTDLPDPLKVDGRLMGILWALNQRTWRFMVNGKSTWSHRNHDQNDFWSEPDLKGMTCNEPVLWRKTGGLHWSHGKGSGPSKEYRSSPAQRGRACPAEADANCKRRKEKAGASKGTPWIPRCLNSNIRHKNNFRRGVKIMIWVLLAIGILLLIPLFFKTIGFVLRVIFGIIGPLLIIAVIILLLLGIIF